MITITVQKESNLYNIYHMIKAFYPSSEITQKVDEKASHFVSINFEGEDEFSFDITDKNELDKSLYKELSKRSRRELAWGMLMGVRPTKLATRELEEGKTEEEIVDKLRKERYISEEKARLAYKIAVREREVLRPLDYENGFSLYVGIPFCPSVCSYCSFSSGSYDAYKGIISDYIDTLCAEIRIKAGKLKGKALNTIYIGGGTPTSLSAPELERVLRCTQESFNMDNLLEYTVEAGRPDSITAEKLAVLKSYPVSRISINPQSMQQKTLDIIGRSHSVSEVYTAYELARNMGFDDINMDLILGLPGEGVSDVRDTLDRIEKLAPDALTVHTLAIKRASRLTHIDTSGDVIEEMVEMSREKACEMGLSPYYLYRQKNIGGNFENTGYSKVDKAGIYNILIMEEKQSIIACGAGATTKIKLREKTKYKGKETTLIRSENVKNIKQYIERGVDQWL